MRHRNSGKMPTNELNVGVKSPPNLGRGCLITCCYSPILGHTACMPALRSPGPPTTRSVYAPPRCRNTPAIPFPGGGAKSRRFCGSTLRWREVRRSGWDSHVSVLPRRLRCYAPHTKCRLVCSALICSRGNETRDWMRVDLHMNETAVFAPLVGFRMGEIIGVNGPLTRRTSGPPIPSGSGVLFWGYPECFVPKRKL